MGPGQDRSAHRPDSYEPGISASGPPRAETPRQRLRSDAFCCHRAGLAVANLFESERAMVNLIEGLLESASANVDPPDRCRRRGVLPALRLRMVTPAPGSTTAASQRCATGEQVSNPSPRSCSRTTAACAAPSMPRAPIGSSLSYRWTSSQQEQLTAPGFRQIPVPVVIQKASARHPNGERSYGRHGTPRAVPSG